MLTKEIRDAVIQQYLDEQRKRRTWRDSVAGILDLSHLRPFRDLILFSGALVLVYGVGVVWRPAAWLLLGGELILLSWALAPSGIGKEK